MLKAQNTHQHMLHAARQLTLTRLRASRDVRSVFDADQGRPSVLKACGGRRHLLRATRQWARARMPAKWFEYALTVFDCDTAHLTHRT